MYDKALIGNFINNVYGNVICSNWQGRKFVTKGSESLMLPDTIYKQYTADIDFVADKNLILVPALLANSVEVYILNA